jgi:CheY-like chemotaxis protein
VVSPDDRGELAELLRRVGEGESVRLETQHLRSDGERIDVALTAAPLRDRADAVVGVSVIARDVSEVQRAQRLQRLRAEPRTADIPVVVLSADARPGLIKRLLTAGARNFLTKPLDVAELLGLLDEVADERQRSRSTPAGSPS